MTVLHRKTLERAEIVFLPDLSMQNARRATHVKFRKILILVHLTRSYFTCKLIAEVVTYYGALSKHDINTAE